MIPRPLHKRGLGIFVVSDAPADADVPARETAEEVEALWIVSGASALP